MLAGTGASFASGAFQTGSTSSGGTPSNRPFIRQGTSDTTPRARPQNRGHRSRPFTRAGTAAPSHDAPNTCSPNQANDWSSNPAAPQVSKFSWPEQSSGSSGGPAPGGFNLGAFRPGDKRNGGGAAASGAFKFSFGPPTSQGLTMLASTCKECTQNLN